MVHGRPVDFGKVEGDEKGKAALDKWLDKRDDLLAGRTLRTKAAGLSLLDNSARGW